MVAAVTCAFTAMTVFLAKQPASNKAAWRILETNTFGFHSINRKSLLVIRKESWYSLHHITDVLKIKLLQFEPTNAHNFIKVTTSQHTSSYMFQDLLASEAQNM